MYIENQRGWVTRQNGSGQNGTDKMIWTKWYTDKMVYNFIFCVHSNSVEFSIIFRNQKSQIN